MKLLEAFSRMGHFIGQSAPIPAPDTEGDVLRVIIDGGPLRDIPNPLIHRTPGGTELLTLPDWTQPIRRLSSNPRKPER